MYKPNHLIEKLAFQIAKLDSLPMSTRQSWELVCGARCVQDKVHYGVAILYYNKSAHTALAVKACLLGGNSNTKCSMTFVNIAVAISALAGGGAKNGFAPRPDPKNGFAPRPEYGFTKRSVSTWGIFNPCLGLWENHSIHNFPKLSQCKPEKTTQIPVNPRKT